MRRLMILTLASAILTACGVKGPLYLPEKRYPQPNVAPSHQPSPKAGEPIFQPEPSELVSQPQQEQEAP